MEYVTIRVSTLRGDQKIGFNVYVKINEKMILYLRRGDSFEGERLKRLKEKKLKKMYITAEEENGYRDYMQKNIEVAYDDKSGKDIQTRADIIQGAQQGHVEEVFENPEIAEAYYAARDSAGKYVDFLLNNDSALSAVLNIENIDGSLAHHGVNVASLSVALAQKLGKVDQKQTQLMTLGALLHDYGHHGSDLNLSRPVSAFQKDELEKYQKHPGDGVLKVQDKQHFDKIVLSIIAQHEELIDGSGYPKKLKEKDTDPLAVIVSSANVMDRMMSFEGIPRAEAGKTLMMNHIGKHPLNHLQLLAEIIKKN